MVDKEQWVLIFPSVGYGESILITFLVIVQWKITKQMENSDCHSSIFYNTTVTANLFEILKEFPEIYFEYGIKCFPQFWYEESTSIKSFRQF